MKEPLSRLFLKVWDRKVLDRGAQHFGKLSALSKKEKNMGTKIDKFPKYYDVNDTPVVAYKVGNDVATKSANGIPFSIGKTLTEGYPISKSEYTEMAEALYGANVFKVLKNAISKK